MERFDSGKLRVLLKKRNIKQCQFAINCGIYPATLSTLLNGWMPAGEKVKKKLLQGMKSSGFTSSEIDKILIT